MFGGGSRCLIRISFLLPLASAAAEERKGLLQVEVRVVAIHAEMAARDHSYQWIASKNSLCMVHNEPR